MSTTKQILSQQPSFWSKTYLSCVDYLQCDKMIMVTDGEEPSYIVEHEEAFSTVIDKSIPPESSPHKQEAEDSSSCCWGIWNCGWLLKVLGLKQQTKIIKQAQGIRQENCRSSSKDLKEFNILNADSMVNMDTVVKGSHNYQHRKDSTSLPQSMFSLQQLEQNDREITVAKPETTTTNSSTKNRIKHMKAERERAALCGMIIEEPQEKSRKHSPNSSSLSPRKSPKGSGNRDIGSKKGESSGFDESKQRNKDQNRQQSQSTFKKHRRIPKFEVLQVQNKDTILLQDPQSYDQTIQTVQTGHSNKKKKILGALRRLPEPLLEAVQTIEARFQGNQEQVDTPPQFGVVKKKRKAKLLSLVPTFQPNEDCRQMLEEFST